jgi:hypothetical protein
VKPRIKSALLYLLKPKAIILGFTLFYYVVDRVSWEQLMASCQPLPCYPGDHIPAVGDPFKLLSAAFFLVLNRWWGNLIALLVSGKLIYEYGYLMLVSCSFMREQPVLSGSVFRCWWQISAFEAPHHLLRFILALLIFSFASASLARYILQRWNLRRNGV